MSKKVPPTIVSSAKPSRSLARPPRLSPALLVSLLVLFCSLFQFLLLSLFLFSFFSFHRTVAPLQPPLPRTHTAPKAAHIGGRFSLPVPRFFRSVFSCELHARVPSVKTGFRVVHSSDSTAARNRTNSAGIKKRLLSATWIPAGRGSRTVHDAPSTVEVLRPTVIYSFLN